MWALAMAAAFGALVPIIFAGDAPVAGADVVYRLVGGSFAAFGLVAWHRRPESYGMATHVVEWLDADVVGEEAARVVLEPSGCLA